MGFSLKKKKILLISPDNWGQIHLAKHNYAIELSKENEVYFLNPPKHKGKNFQINKAKGYENIWIIDHKFFFPYNLRFHFNPLFNLLVKFYIKLLLKKIRVNFDILWCFDTNLYHNLKLFRTDLSIYHPVDEVLTKYQYKICESADYVFSVSQPILDSLPAKKKFLIPHGLSNSFTELAKQNLLENRMYNIKYPLNIGYVGNLFFFRIDHSIFIKIIEDHPSILFHFWGPYDAIDSNIGSDNSLETLLFLDFLKTSDNVILHGVSKPQVLAKEIQNMDGFIICYKVNTSDMGITNSHKVKEYLSTGKVIISNYISTYSNYKHLINMPEDNNNEELPSIFKHTIENIKSYNNDNLRKERLNLSLSSTYNNNLEKIEEIIDASCNKTLNLLNL